MQDLCDGRRALHDRQQSNRYRQTESARTAGARVEIEHAFMASNIRLVRMAIKNSRKFRGRRIQMNRLHVMQHVEVLAFEKHDLGFRKLATFACPIDVAANCRNWRDMLERFDDFKVADIPEMQNVFDSAKRGYDLRTQQAMCIADNANLHLLKLNRTGQRRRTLTGLVERTGFVT